jgi:DNA-binding XRE family transcriptional regulator
MLNHEISSDKKEVWMDTEEFFKFRKRLGKTQKEMAEILGISMKAVHSYEQGWRKIPSHIERQIFFLLSNRKGKQKSIVPCWEIKHCGMKEQCPAWEFQSGHLCWFLCGTLCTCTQGCSLEEKTERCRSCEILQKLLE